jgi:2-oxoglutarate ferredoxin oxidoreductase subunit gamma
MSDVIQIMLGGFGGQGIVLMGIILGDAAVREGLWAAGSNSYGAQARGSACRSEVVISREPVDYPHVLEADLLVAMSQAAYDTYTDGLAREGLVIYDSSLIKPDRSLKCVQAPIPATRLVLEEMKNRQVANMVLLGALAALTKVVSPEAMEAALAQWVPSRSKDVNLRALRAGMDLADRLDCSLRRAFSKLAPWSER